MNNRTQTSTARIVTGYKNKESTQNIECSLKRNLPKSVPLDALHRRPRFKSKSFWFQVCSISDNELQRVKVNILRSRKESARNNRGPISGICCDLGWFCLWLPMGLSAALRSERHRKMLMRGVCPLYRWTGRMICGTLSNNSVGNANGWNRHAHQTSLHSYEQGCRVGEIYGLNSTPSASKKDFGITGPTCQITLFVNLCEQLEFPNQHVTEICPLTR
jgi:hypothetical protein